MSSANFAPCCLFNREHLPCFCCPTFVICPRQLDATHCYFALLHTHCKICTIDLKELPSFASSCVSVPENPPVNVSAVLNGTEVLMTWEGPPGKLNGELQGYRVEYQTPAAQPVSLGHVKSQTKLKDHFVLTTVAFSDSSTWIPGWTPSCQSTSRRRCPMCLSEFVPIPGQGGGPGPPHRL